MAAGDEASRIALAEATLYLSTSMRCWYQGDASEEEFVDLLQEAAGRSHQKVLERAQGYYWDGWDPDLVGRGALRCKVFVPTLYAPSLAPPGGQIVVLQKVLEMDYDAVEDWPAHKAAIEAVTFERLRRVVPDVDRKIVVSTSASAKTSHRFTLNHQGAMLGWEMAPDQLGDDRPGTEGPLAGLWFAGHWTRPGGGITPVMVSALQVAERITGSSRNRTAMALPGDLMGAMGASA